jgi:hypothetical protein
MALIASGCQVSLWDIMVISANLICGDYLEGGLFVTAVWITSAKQDRSVGDDNMEKGWTSGDPLLLSSDLSTRSLHGHLFRTRWRLVFEVLLFLPVPCCALAHGL